MTETRYQRIAREQAERQKARAERFAKVGRAEATKARKTRLWAREARRERAYIDWATSDFPNQEDN